MKKVIMKDVAKLANVSKSTVSQYFNKRYEYMSEETKQRIEAAVKELSYQPNFVARSLKQKKTFTIGVIVANILHYFSTKVSRAIEDVCNQNGIHVIICNADDLPTKEANYIKMLLAKQVDGLIVFPTGRNKEIYEQMLKTNIPIVFIDRIIENLPVDTVILDNEKAVETAVDHFVDKGHERIAIITTSLELKVTPRIERINGFRKVINERNLPFDDRYAQGVELSEIPETLDQILSLPHPPTAVLAANDLVLAEILKYSQKNGIKIPDKLAVIGIDEVPYASFFEPPITTIGQPVYEMGEIAAKLLLDKINGRQEEAPKVHRFPPILNTRKTT